MGEGFDVSLDEGYKKLPRDKMSRAIVRKARPTEKDTRQQLKIMKVGKEHSKKKVKAKEKANRAGKGEHQKITPEVTGHDRERLDVQAKGKKWEDPYVRAKRGELERQIKKPTTDEIKKKEDKQRLNRDRKRLDYAYKLDKKKEKQGVGSKAGQNDSDGKYFRKALSLEKQRRGDLDKQAQAKIKRPRTRLKSVPKPGTIKKKK